MKHQLRLLAVGGLVVLALTACERRNFTIEGTISEAADSMLYLENVSLKGIEHVDSVRLKADGRFSFSEQAPEAPEFYMLRIGQRIINLSIDSTETVTVTASCPTMGYVYEVEGSDNCQQIKQLTQECQKLQARVIQVSRDYSLSTTEMKDSLLRMVEAYKRHVMFDYIARGPQHAYSYFALFQRLGNMPVFDPDARGIDMQAYSAVATSWDTFYPGTDRTRNLHNIAIENRKNQLIIDARNAQTFDGTVVESGIIELELTDNHGQIQRLSSLKGKVVLLDFHSFAMKNSPQRILMLRDIYNKYHDRGLEIYQVSIDADEHFWKQQTRQLPWISVIDGGTGSVVKYNVQALPEYFLIDRQSQLQKRSSQMTDLEQEIKALL